MAVIHALPTLALAPPEAVVTIHVDDRLLQIEAMPERLPVRKAEIGLLRVLFGDEIDALICGSKKETDL